MRGIQSLKGFEGHSSEKPLIQTSPLSKCPSMLKLTIVPPFPSQTLRSGSSTRKRGGKCYVPGSTWRGNVVTVHPPF